MSHSDPPPGLPSSLETLSAQVTGMIAHVELAKRAAEAAQRAREPLTRRERLVVLFLGAFLGAGTATIAAAWLIALGVVLGRR